MRELLKYNSAGTLNDYAITTLADYCMPTLLKAKPSNLVCVNKSFMGNPVHFLNRIKQEIDLFDCNCIALYESRKLMILLIYNQQLLCEILSCNENRKVLEVYGYDNCEDIVTSALKRIKQRYLDYCYFSAKFPHEIGIMLGYPHEDVEAFIKYEGKNYLLSGCWKVYHDVASAEITFELFHRIKEDTRKIITSGGNLKDLKEAYRIK
jgi:hypothetical protein